MREPLRDSETKRERERVKHNGTEMRKEREKT